MIDMEEGAIFRDEIEIFVLLFSCFETRSRLDIVILMFRDENEKHRLNFSRSSEKNLSQFSRDLARTRILADLCLREEPPVKAMKYHHRTRTKCSVCGGLKNISLI